MSYNQTPDEIFPLLVRAVGENLNCDRVFLYLRNPQTQTGTVPYCWCRNSKYPDVTTGEWKKEPESLAQEDPLFAAALRTEPSIFVEDVETANPAIVNKDFEAKAFGHRALIHAHLCSDGLLWGVLQPCVLDRSRSRTDRRSYRQNCASSCCLRNLGHTRNLSVQTALFNAPNRAWH